jgi:RNA polymerase sigma-70 factor (ECF subfamily)
MELAETYLCVQRDAWDAKAADPTALSDAIRAIVEDGRRAWAGVQVEPDVLAAYLAERAPDQTEPLVALRAMQTTDLYLACACARGDAKAIAHFEQSVLPHAEPAISRIDKDPEFVGDLLHEVRVRLLVDGENGAARIKGYLGRGPLTSWVQVVAMRAAYSAKRVKPAVPEDAEELSLVPFDGEDAELARIRRELAGPFARAFGEALASLGARERNVLRLYLLEGVSSEAIGRMYRVHRATVARWIARIHETLLSETKKRLSRELGIGSREVESFMRVLSSKLEVSIATVLSA